VNGAYIVHVDVLNRARPSIESEDFVGKVDYFLRWNVVYCGASWSTP